MLIKHIFQFYNVENDLRMLKIIFFKQNEDS